MCPARSWIYHSRMHKTPVILNKAYEHRPAMANTSTSSSRVEKKSSSQLGTRLMLTPGTSGAKGLFTSLISNAIPLAYPNVQMSYS
ncbi:hypothetical protein M3J09_007995 [Ascochyta lentis]